MTRNSRGQVPSARAALLALSLLLPGAACASWHTLPKETLRTSHGLRDRLQLWVHGRSYLLHGVGPVNDSVAGVPIHLPPTCDSCALRFAVADVDSVRSLDTPRTAGSNLAWAIPVGLLIAFVVWGLPALAGGMIAGG